MGYVIPLNNHTNSCFRFGPEIVQSYDYTNQIQRTLNPFDVLGFIALNWNKRRRRPRAAQEERSSKTKI